MKRSEQQDLPIPLTSDAHHPCPVCGAPVMDSILDWECSDRCRELAKKRRRLAEKHQRAEAKRHRKALRKRKEERDGQFEIDDLINMV